MNRLVEFFTGPRAFLPLFVAAFGLRLFYCWEQSLHNPLFDFPTVDASVYWRWAGEMAGGKWLWTEMQNYHPAYPLFLAACKLFLWGDSAWGVKIVQALLGSAAAVLLAAAAGRVLGRRAGLLAGWGFACTWMFILHDAEMYAENLGVFALAAGLYVLFCRPPGCSRALLAGGAGALAVACRPNLLLLVPVAAAALVFWPRWPGRRAGLYLALFGSMFLLALVPVILRNHTISGGWALRAQQNWNVYAALEPAFGGLHPAAGIAFDNQMRRPLTVGRGNNSPQIEAYWKDQTRELLRTQPGAVAWNFLVVRGLVFLDAVEWGQEFDLYAYRAASSLLRLPLPGFGWIFPLACAGLFWVWRERLRGTGWRLDGTPGRDGARLLLLFLLAAVLATFPFKVTGRYRLPVVLFLLPFAGAALDSTINLLREKRFRLLGTGAAVFLAAAAVCWPDWADLRHRQTALHEFYIGLHYRDTGNLDQAEAVLRAGLSRQPHNADTPQLLAELLLARGRPEEAMPVVREALCREPEFWKAWNTRARIALALGRQDEALDCVSRSLALLASQPEPWLIRRLIHARAGRWAEEEGAFRAAIQAGAAPAVVLEYGTRLEAKGCWQEALLRYGAVIEDAALPSPIRARGCMLAGYLFVRRLHDPGRAATFWRRIPAEFAAADFFTDQALYLTDAISEELYMKKVAAGGSPAASAYCTYNRSLRRRLQNDPAGADLLLRQLARGESADGAGEPEQWAREELAAGNRPPATPAAQGKTTP